MLKNKIKKTIFVWLICGGSFFLADCRMGNLKKEPAKAPPNGYVPSGAVALTSFGENYRPRFSADGSHIVFISSGQQKHLHPQAYEMKLSFDTTTGKNKASI